MRRTATVSSRTTRAKPREREEVGIDWPERASSRRNPLLWLKSRLSAGLDRLGAMRLIPFLLCVGAMALVLKLVLVPLVALLELKVVPAGVSPLLGVRPLEWLASSASLVVTPAEGLGSTAAPVLCHLLFLAVLFPLVCTVLAQGIPLHALRERIARSGVRATLSVSAMGVLYVLAYGHLSFLVSGVALGLLLVYAFRQRREVSLRQALLVTWGIHGLANGAVVVLLACAGELK